MNIDYLNDDPIPHPQRSEEEWKLLGLISHLSEQLKEAHHLSERFSETIQEAYRLLDKAGFGPDHSWYRQYRRSKHGGSLKRKRVMAAIEATPHATVPKIAWRCEVSQSLVRRVLRELKPKP